MNISDVEFKVRVEGDDTVWEDILVVHTQVMNSWFNWLDATLAANHKAVEIFESLTVDEVRWNFEGSSQGHFVDKDSGYVKGNR